MPAQLTLDGHEVEHPPAETALRASPLTPAQEEILRHIVAVGSIRSVEAGVVMHRHRGHCPHTGNARGPRPNAGIGCCPYAAADGLAALNRLAARELIRRESPGEWRPL